MSRGIRWWSGGEPCKASAGLAAWRPVNHYPKDGEAFVRNVLFELGAASSDG